MARIIPSRTAERVAVVLAIVCLLAGLYTPLVGAADGVHPDSTDDRTQLDRTADRAQLAVTQSSADEPKSADEYLQILYELRGTESFEQTPEFELIRSQAVVELQAETVTDADLERMQTLVAVLEAFDRAYQHRENGELSESFAEAEIANDRLADLESTASDDYGTLGSVALKRFYDQLGADLYEAAQATEATPDRLAILDDAATAYERADNADRYSAIRLEHDELEYRYESDMNRYDAATNRTTAYLQNCTAACEGVVDLVSTAPTGPFAAYTEAQRVHADAMAAADLVDKHGIADRNEEAANNAEQTFQALLAAAIASSLVIAAYLLLSIVATVAIVWRLTTWKRDVGAARTDEVVAERGGIDA